MNRGAGPWADTGFAHLEAAPVCSLHEREGSFDEAGCEGVTKDSGLLLTGRGRTARGLELLI